MVMLVIKWLLSNELFNLGLLPSEPTGHYVTSADHRGWPLVHIWGVKEDL